VHAPWTHVALDLDLGSGTAALFIDDPGAPILTAPITPSSTITDYEAAVGLFLSAPSPLEWRVRCAPTGTEINLINFPPTGTEINLINFPRREITATIVCENPRMGARSVAPWTR
jgi:hypothetical protein